MIIKRPSFTYVGETAIVIANEMHRMDTETMDANEEIFLGENNTDTGSKNLTPTVALEPVETKKRRK